MNAINRTEHQLQSKEERELGSLETRASSAIETFWNETKVLNEMKSTESIMEKD